MRRAFIVLSSVLVVAFALQFVFAAVGAFTKPAADDAYVLHSLTGMAVIPLLTLLTVLFAALARAPGRVIGLSALPLGLVILQALIAGLAKGFTDAAGASTPVSLTIGGLHAVNGIIVVHVAVAVAVAARRLGRPAGEEGRAAGDQGRAVGDQGRAAGDESRAGDQDLAAGDGGRAAGDGGRAAGDGGRPAREEGHPGRGLGRPVGSA